MYVDDQVGINATDQCLPLLFVFAMRCSAACAAAAAASMSPLSASVVEPAHTSMTNQVCRERRCEWGEYSMILLPIHGTRLLLSYSQPTQQSLWHNDMNSSACLAWHKTISKCVIMSLKTLG